MTQVENDLTNPVLLFIVQFLKGFSEPMSRWVIATVQLAQPAMSYELFEELKISNFSSGRNHFSGHQRGFDSIHSQKIGKNLIPESEIFESWIGSDEVAVLHIIEFTPIIHNFERSSDDCFRQV
jgi:hypothetical protein